MWTNQPFFISHRVESRRVWSPEQCGPQLCWFLCVSLAQGVRADLYLFWLYMLSPISFAL